MSAQPAFAQLDPCQVVDDGTGTVSLPPDGCEYLSPTEVHQIIDGLPPGTTIELGAIHLDFICRKGGGGPHCGQPGGNLGGEFEVFDSTIDLQLTGTGDLAGFSRAIQLPMFCQTDTGPRVPGDAVQDFDTEMVQLQGSLFGDPDFDSLQIVGGAANGLPSPGHTTLTRLGPPGSDFQVDSFFDIEYRIDFVGAPGGALDGLSGSTLGTIRMEAHAAPPEQPCQDCGPGPHWIDTCVGGLDTMDTSAWIALDTTLDGNADTTLVLTGPTEVRRDPGDAATHSIQTEILSMSLSDGAGNTLVAGGGGGSGGTLPPSPGMIQETATDPAIGDSFFDIWVEVSLSSGVVLHNNDPVHVQSAITCVPPQADFEYGPNPPIQLVDDNNVVFAQIIQVIHTTFPPPPPPDPHETLDPTTVEFGNGGAVPPIPPDFFGPGSDPFTGQVHFSPTPGEASTVTQRSADPVLPADPVGTSRTVDIELVSLDLVSADPIVVTYNTGDPDELWDLTVSNIGSSGQNSVTPGTLTATKNQPNGGTFNAEFNFCPVITFVKQGTGDVRTLDLCGTPDALPLILNIAGPFVHVVDPTLEIEVPVGAVWVPGVQEEGGTQTVVPMTALSKDQPPSVIHTVGPKEKKYCIYDIICVDGDCSQCPAATAGACRAAACPNDTCGVYAGLTSTCPAGSTCCIGYGQFNCRVPTGEPICPPLGDCVCNPQPGACCTADGACTQTLQQDCQGTFLGEGVPCGSDGACCMPDGSCSVMAQACCDAAGGMFTGAQTCGPQGACCDSTGNCTFEYEACCAGIFHAGDCQPAYGCCLPDGSCTDLDPQCCVDLGGTPKTDGTTCAQPEACCYPGPVAGTLVCTMTDPECCVSQLGGNPLGAGSVCLGDNDGDGSDDACVAQTGACCTAAGTCTNTTQADCNGVWLGTGTACQGDEACCINNTCVIMDAACCAAQGGSPQGPGSTCSPVGPEACCIGNTCTMLDAICCLDQGGSPQGPGSNCSPALEACCFANGSCSMLDRLCCADQGGVPQGAGSVCLGDGDGDGNDDLCVPPVTGACCDLASGTCTNTTQANCNGVWLGAGTACGGIEACCVNNACIMMDVACCLDQGGSPQGPGSNCSPALEACCFANGSCSMLDRLCCADQGGVPQGPGSVCLGDGDGDGNDDLCVPPVTGACCDPTGACTVTTQANCAGVWLGANTACGGVEACCINNTCTMMDAACCLDQGGSPQGAGSTCASTGPEACCLGNTCVMLDPLCCADQGGTPQGAGSACSAAPEACCFGDGTCADLDPLCCLDRGGLPAGVGSFCQGDNNGNNIDDACELECLPADLDGDGVDEACAQVICTDDPNNACEPRCVTFDPLTGFTQVVDCNCRGLDECHVVIPGPPGVPCAGAANRGGPNPCVVPDAGGTVVLPPPGCAYLSPDDVHQIIDGLPPGTTIELGAEHNEFQIQSTTPGGTLGGEIEQFNSNLTISLCGTGDLGGFTRFINIPVACEVHTGPRTPGDPVQSFPNDMFRLQGGLTGDPDFDMLQVTGGTDFGMPSPGHTTLTQLPSGNFNVDSFFDIEYRIDFQGAPGSVLEGYAGSTTATIRMGTGDSPHCEGVCPPDTTCRETRIVNADGTIDLCCDCVAAVVARPMPDADFDLATRTTVSCTTDADCVAGINAASQTYCVLPPGGVPGPGTCYVQRNRYVSIDPNPENAGVSTARRVSLDLGGGSTAVLGWVSEPVEKTLSGPEVTPQLLSRIVDAPHYRDWSVDNTGAPWTHPTVHVGDCQTSPGHTYLIQAIAEGADTGNEANYSEALSLRTVRDFGDVVGANPGTPPDSVRNFKDVSAVVRGFQSIQTEPKNWLDLQGSNATPPVPDFSDINFADINHAVAGFQGGGYPFPVPLDCP